VSWWRTVESKIFSSKESLSVMCDFKCLVQFLVYLIYVTGYSVAFTKILVLSVIEKFKASSQC